MQVTGLRERLLMIQGFRVFDVLLIHLHMPLMEGGMEVTFSHPASC
jgi:hypothetical protein